MLWINFLHFYQPATLDRHTIVEAIEKSYLRIIKSLLKNSNAHFSLSISGCLLEKMDEFGYHSLIGDIKTLTERGQIELVGTAAFHPILPLIPETEAMKQIQIQEAIIKKYFGNVKLKGFFLPEMAYAKKTATLIKSLDYEWLLLDEISSHTKMKINNHLYPYLDNDSGLTIVFRQRELSQSYVPQKILEMLEQNHSTTVITATDAELYGLRHQDTSGHLEQSLQHPALKTATISDFITQHKNLEKISLRPSNWESTEKDLRRGQPFILWYNTNNRLHRKLWKLAQLAWEAVEKYPDDINHFWAEQHLRRGLASCSFWWASGKTLPLWNTLSWNPDEIERGLNELIKSVRAIENEDARATKIKAEKLYIKIKKMIWARHWAYFWKR